MSVRASHHHLVDDRPDPAAQDHRRDRHREPAHAHPQNAPRAAERPRQRAEVEPARQRRTSHRRAAPAFSLDIAGHQIRLGPVAFWTAVGTLVIMAGWSAVTATYFAFQDDVLTRMMARQAEMQYAYEDRLAEMRAQVDRATSRQLLDQEQLEQKLDQIVRRQSVLEQRAATLGAVADPTATGALRGMLRSPAPPAAGALPLKPSPISGPKLFGAPSAREAKLDPVSVAGPPGAARPRTGNVQTLLSRLTESLDRVETRQTNALAALEENYTAKARRIRSVLADVGVDASKLATAATGGPFVPYRLAPNAGPFERQVYRVAVARAQAERLSGGVAAVPLRKPVEGEIDTSSGFGVRIDPFLGKPAMHTGLDFRGDTGDEIHVTAAGTVVSAGWSGGYGRMVEVSHGNGLSTRYGHLSEIDVHVGQALKAGQTVGRLGSTGRSTGPHLHYETRIDGEAVDPQRFLHAGAKFGLM